jgi:pyrophosphate--fructose-6-phosphate 1-phosphotransferase
MSALSPLQQYRLTYSPPLPLSLQSIEQLVASTHSQQTGQNSLESLFVHTANQPILNFNPTSKMIDHQTLKVGVVLSGGQAPGGHNVIAGLFDALKKLNKQSQLIGFLNGPSGIVKNQSIAIDSQKLHDYRNQGGFDLIGSGRGKIETAEDFAAAEATVTALDLDGLVIIGGDDSNTNAAFLAEHFKKKGIKTAVVGVPKTIDGDLKNELIEISFGFDTACKIYSEIIGNILKDMLSAKKYYYFIKLMGRSASHVTLECALQTQVNMALIGEEISQQKYSLKDVTNQIVEMICKRAAQGKNFGAILISEGIVEFIPEFKQMIQELNAILSQDLPHSEQQKDFKANYLIPRLSQEAANCFINLPPIIQDQLILDRDPHGNVQVSKIETERLLISMVEKELYQRQKEGNYIGKFAAQPLFCGYEGRSGLPSNFDCQYCYALGHVAALLVSSKASGYMCCVGDLTRPVEQWSIAGIPIFEMLHLEMREGKQKAVIRKALVDLQGAPFLAFASKRAQWLLEDHFSCPGPIQFNGPKDITDSVPYTLSYEHASMPTGA